MTRPCLRFLVVFADIPDLRESNELQIRKTMPARKKYVQLMENVHWMNEKDVYRERRYLPVDTEYKWSLLSVSKCDSILELARIRMGNTYRTFMGDLYSNF